MSKKDKIKKLEIYLQLCVNKFTSDIPEKHRDRPLEYRAYIQKDIDLTKKCIDNIKLEV